MNRFDKWHGDSFILQRYSVSGRTDVRPGLFHGPQFGGNPVQDGAEHQNSPDVHPSAPVGIDFLSNMYKPDT